MIKRIVELIISESQKSVCKVRKEGKERLSDAKVEGAGVRVKLPKEVLKILKKAQCAQLKEKWELTRSTG